MRLPAGLILSAMLVASLGCQEYEQRKKAAQEAVEACDGGDQEACRDLGEMYEFGRGVNRSTIDALRLYEQACEAGVLDACLDVGWLYRKGSYDLASDFAKSEAFYRKACDGGLIKGCHQMGALYWERAIHDETGKPLPGRRGDVARARSLWTEACEQHNYLDSCVALAGLLGPAGEGSDRDWPRAIALFLRACEGGQPEGCFMLGLGYAEGEEGLPRDVEKARVLIRRACESGVADACETLEGTGKHQVNLAGD